VRPVIGWWDCSAGASGDMCLGALVGVGVPLGTLQEAVDGLGVERVVFAVSEVERQGVPATKVDVHTAPSGVVRTWPNLRDLLERAPLAEPVRATALGAFARLAAAEAQVHRSTPEQVHFHEVGALDALADIVGTAAGLHALGLTELTAAPVALGSGMARSDHGLLPVPVPAVLEILRAVGAPVRGGPAAQEMCTPTGAALLAETAASWGALPGMRLTAVGTGAGGRDLDEVPNVLRLVVGESVDESVDAPTDWVVIEANVDDQDPRLWPAVLTGLLAAGAYDAWLTPILMKKGRPAHTLSVLVPTARAGTIRRLVFTETSTIGVREHRVGKTALERSLINVDVDGVPIRVKAAWLDGALVNATPEYDDVAAAAVRLSRPVKAVLAAAAAAASQALSVDGAGKCTRPSSLRRSP